MTDIRSQFSILRDTSVIYLDSAASSLTPDCVIASMQEYYYQYRANIHRGMYDWSIRATEACDRARDTVAQFIRASRAEEIIFVRGATDGINLIAELIQDQISPGQSIVLSVAEHHSNLLPWQELARVQGLELRYAPVSQGGIDEQAMVELIDETTAIVAVTHVSNVLGSVTHLDSIIEKAHSVGAQVVVDGSQAVAHIPVDVSRLRVDWYVFSGHKVYGPTGIGVVYGRYDLLANLRPTRTGGDMVTSVSLHSFDPSPVPQCFEPGTPPIAEIIGLARAIHWLQKLGWEMIRSHERDLIHYAWSQVVVRPWLQIFGPEEGRLKVGCMAFQIQGIHPHDIAHILGTKGIAVRAGFHCAEPLARALEMSGTTRISWGIYTTREDIDRFFEALDQVYQLFRR